MTMPMGGPRGQGQGKKLVKSLIRKKIMVAAAPWVLGIIAVLLVIFMLMAMLMMVFGGSDEKGGTDEVCLDVGNPSPTVSANGVNPPARTGGSNSPPPGGEIAEDDLGLPVPYDWVQAPTSGFGPRWGSFHYGLDLAGAGAEGQPIWSVGDGTVIRVANDVGGYGGWVIIRHEIDGQIVDSLYGHMWYGSGIYVEEGQEVKAGDHIADVGNDGGSTGAHLHFGVYPGGHDEGGGSPAAVDPMTWLPTFQEEAKKSGGDRGGARDRDRDDEDEDEDGGDTATTARTAPNRARNAAAADEGVVTAEVWDQLAECESGGNWAIDTGNGYSGGLQFSPQTWLAFGGDEFAPTAGEAGREEQMEVANRVLAEQGWGAWPACSSAAGEAMTSLKPAPEGSFLNGDGGGNATSGDDEDEDRDRDSDSGGNTCGGGRPGEPLEAVEKGSYDGAQPVEEALQIDAVRLLRNVAARYPEVGTYGGTRYGDPQDHGKGAAIDIMLVPHTDPAWVALGDEINDWLQANADELNITYLIWKQRIWMAGSPPDAWSFMEDRGDITQNHYDHIHVSVEGGGMPTAATDITAIEGMSDPYGPPETTIDGQEGVDAATLTTASGDPGRESATGDQGGSCPSGSRSRATRSGSGDTGGTTLERADLEGIDPYPLTAPQLAMQLNQEQQAVVQALIGAAKDSRIPEEHQPRAAVIGSVLAGQSNTFINRRAEDDRNKVGIFAEAGSRNSSNRTLEDPRAVAKKFYKKLRDEYGDDDSWTTKPVEEVILALYPERKSLEEQYPQWENIAIDAVSQLWDTPPAAKGVSINWADFTGEFTCAIGATPGTSGSRGNSTTGAALNEGEVPEDYVKWIKLGAQECDAVTEPVLAAQIHLEGGFQPHEPRDVGGGQIVGGRTQFLYETWQAWGYEVDENGEQIGTAGGGDWNDIGDAVMAQARFNCANAEIMEEALNDGRVVGDLTELMIAAYQSGPGGPLKAGKVPDNISDGNMTPRQYVDHIMEHSRKFEDPDGRLATNRSRDGNDSDRRGNRDKNDDDDGLKAVTFKERIVEAARTQEGVDYAWGGGTLDGPSEGHGPGAGTIGFDCSALTRYAVYQASGKKIDITRTTETQPSSEHLRPTDNPEPGDLMYVPGHTAVYIGDGKVFEASTTGVPLGEGKVQDGAVFYEVVE